MTFTLPHVWLIIAWFVTLACVVCAAISAMAGWSRTAKTGWGKFVEVSWSWLAVLSLGTTLVLAARAL